MCLILPVFLIAAPLRGVYLHRPVRYHIRRFYTTASISTLSPEIISFTPISFILIETETEHIALFQMIIRFMSGLQSDFLFDISNIVNTGRYH